MSKASIERACTNCFELGSAVAARSHRTLAQAVLDLSAKIGAGLLPCMCEGGTGQFNVCYARPARLDAAAPTRRRTFADLGLG